MSDLEFWGPSQALRALFDLEKVSPAELKKMNESMLADAFEDEAIAPPPSSLASEALEFLYAIQHLYSSVRRFKALERMFRHYPWRGTISKGEQSVYHLFVHECYVFEERLKKFFAKADNYASTKGLSAATKKEVSYVMNLHKRAFGGAVRMRGVHVHQEEFLPRDIRRVGLIETLTFAYGVRDEDASKVWTKFRDAVAAQIRRDWVQHCRDAQSSTEIIATQAFSLTKLIWQELAREGRTERTC